ncbi:MAG: signal peptidase I [Candidatus Schekmanbacteria bacterium RBG_13_48_7]|uniref:Signal peptidase I n=1 Tax=Candidatus Schekmanbacteria bacterium RBG_13_48_7 TaxID=1817878 RepID=A0A1F7RM61_9BACT|nr:MAG: signal peptidase I [Candidatus Schekmanbacteria bacterium RBG_13_48_7]
MLKFLINIFKKIPISIFVVEGSSMYPRLKRGDLIVVVKSKNISVSVDDIIVFRNPEIGLIAHRIIKITETGLFTRGDNNVVQDPEIINKDQILGRVRVRIPWLGFPRIWLKMLTHPVDQ